MIFFTLTLIGTAVFACGGALAAIKSKMDLGGVIITAFIVGTGGGTLRALFLGKGSVFWVTQPIYLVITLATGLLTFIAAYILRQKIPSISSKNSLIILNRGLLTADAIGLGLFSVAGTQIALDARVSTISAIIIGTFSAVGGVILRDILCHTEQTLLKSDIYATAALAGATSYILLTHIVPIDIAVCISVFLAFTIRMTAVFFKLKLPMIK